LDLREKRMAKNAKREAVFIFGPEDGDGMFLRNVGIYGRFYTAPKPR
jgi:hypothetical protein